MRTAVKTHAQRMEFRLQENDSKQPWIEMTQNYLFMRATLTLERLKDAVCANNHGKVMEEGTNLSNYGMMLTDNATRLMSRDEDDLWVQMKESDLRPDFGEPVLVKTDEGHKEVSVLMLDETASGDDIRLYWADQYEDGAFMYEFDKVIAWRQLP